MARRPPSGNLLAALIVIVGGPAGTEEVDVTAEAQTDVPADVTGAPSLTLDDAQLGDLELLLSGAFAPLTGFMGVADVAAAILRGTLADRTPWPASAPPAGGPRTLPDDPPSAVPAAPTPPPPPPPPAPPHTTPQPTHPTSH